jgi:hypothetical protein
VVAIETERPYKTRAEQEYFYAWIRFAYGVTKGRVSWDKGDDVGRIKKWLILHGYKITKIALRREYVTPSIEDQALQSAYENELQDFIL